MIPVSGRFLVCLMFEPGFCCLMPAEGSTTLSVIVALPMEAVAVMVMEAARSGAVNLVELPDVVERLPPVVVQLALPCENVRFTSSPTPTLVRARSAGAVATVCEVI